MRYLSAAIMILAMNSLPLNGQNHFQPGERLRFIIYFGPITGGEVRTTLEAVQYSDRLAYHGRLVARSTGITDKIYKVKDVYDCIFDPDTLLPLKSIRDIREGRYAKFNEVWYDHRKNEVNSFLSGRKDVPPGIMDMVTTFFYIRNVRYDTLQEGEIIKINTFFDDELFPFDMKYSGRESIKTRMGTFDCIKLIPFVEPGRIFNSEDDMTIWLSNDRNRVPIRVRFDLIVGSLKCDLIEFSGLKH